MRPGVIPWFKAYSAFLTLLYLAVIVYGAFMASRPAVFEMPEGFGRLLGLTLAALGLAFALGFAAGLFLPRRPWAWVYGLVLICIGLNGCTLPFWHHAFQVWGYVAGVATDGFFREITPIEFQGLPQGDVGSIRQSDDDYYRIRAAHTFRLSRAHNAALLLETRFPTFPLQRMDLVLETGTHTQGVRQEVALFDFVANRWVVLDDRPLPPGEDVTIALESIPSPERFLRPSDGKTLAKLEAYSWGTNLATHELRVDTAKFVVTYE